jgi:hypothetical protein
MLSFPLCSLNRLFLIRCIFLDSPKFTKFAFLRTKNGIDGGSLDSDGITKAGLAACWTRMVQPMTHLTLMAHRMALTMAHRWHQLKSLLHSQPLVTGPLKVAHCWS